VVTVAGVIGVYAGIAAGLFSQSIRFVQLLLFRSDDLRRALFLSPGAPWRLDFERRLLASRWHLEFLATAGVLLVAAFVVEQLSEHRTLQIPILQAQRLWALGLAGAFGLVLYYPLLVLATFNRTFHETDAGLYGILLAVPRWKWVLAPALGALGAGLLVRYVSPESGGHGVVEVIEGVHKGRWEHLRGRVAIWKSLAAGLVIGSGGSAGREGPVVHLGGSVAAFLGKQLSLPRKQIALLLACGGGAGIAASFRAPIAGSMFALEIILGDFSVTSFTPIVLASVTATVTASALGGPGTDVQSVQWQLGHPAEIVIYLVLGVVAGACGALYIRAIRGAETIFGGHAGGELGRRLGQLRPEWRAAVGGLCVGVLALVAPRIMGTGIESMNAALAGELTLRVLAITLIFKLLSTACTLGSGSPGGSFFPAVFVGAMAGGAFGRAAHWLLPGIASRAEPYAAVAMGAVVSGATTAPLTGVLMMFELTGSYQIVLPLLVACGVAAAVVQGWVGGSIYALGARARGIRLHSRESTLRDLSVASAVEEVEAIPEDAPWAVLVQKVAETTHRAFPVVSRNGDLVGLISPRLVRGALHEPALAGVAVARDLCRTDVPVLSPDDDLETALQRLAEADASEAIVLSSDEPRRVLGIFTREGALAAWRSATQAA
jgi:CIC family chloride channel protein